MIRIETRKIRKGDKYPGQRDLFHNYVVVAVIEQKIRATGLRERLERVVAFIEKDEARTLVGPKHTAYRLWLGGESGDLGNAYHRLQDVEQAIYSLLFKEWDTTQQRTLTDETEEAEHEPA